MLFLFILALTAIGAFAQQNAVTLPDGSLDLNAPSLQQHASDWHSQSGVMPGGDDLVQPLQDSTPYAAQKGLQTNGLSFHIHTDGPMATRAGLLSVLPKNTCTSDAIMVGNISGQESHFTSNRKNVYTDYAFTVQQTLKGAPAKQIVLLRVGGSVQGIATGSPLTSVDMEYDQYPNLQPNATYLVFLDLIAATGAYSTTGMDATLVEDSNGQWMFVATALSHFVFPELAQGTLEKNISNWLKSCH